MAKEFAKSFYNSKRWKECRKAYKNFKLGICERCGSANGTEVHHKIMLTEDNINNPQITLNFDNLELLCQTCHAQHHNRKHRFYRNDVCFDEFGDLVKNPKVKQYKDFGNLGNVFQSPHLEFLKQKRKRPHPQFQKMKVESHGGVV